MAILGEQLMLPIPHKCYLGNGVDLWLGRCWFCYEIIPEDELNRLIREREEKYDGTTSDWP